MIRSARLAAHLAGQDVPPMEPPPPEPEPEPELPPLGRQAAGLAATALAVAADAFRRAKAEEQERRMAICNACDHLTADGRCGKRDGCGCRVRAKSAWRASRCPLGKWETPASSS